MFVNLYNSNFHYLENLIKSISVNQGFHICIYDIAGIFHDNPLLSLPSHNRFHHAAFCDTVKTTSSGLRLCMKCKYFSIRKAASEKTGYCAQCYMGITEIVRPVFFNDKLLAVIYLGNLLINERYNQTVEIIKRKSKRIGVSEKMLLDSLNTVQRISENSITEYDKIVEMLYYSIVFAYTHSSRKNQMKKNSPHKTNHWLIETIRDYVQGYYHNQIRLEHIAGLHFINPNYLRGVFKKEVGMSFTDYVNKVRLDNAILLLENTRESVLDISLQVGFNNVTYFNRLFKAYTGQSPSEYRQMLT